MVYYLFQQMAIPDVPPDAQSIDVSNDNPFQFVLWDEDLTRTSSR